jgi:integrase
MNFVEPIRERKKISQIKNLLRGQYCYLDLLLFVVGIDTALRISDLLELRISHFLDKNRRIKGRFWIKEQKRGKQHEVVINNSIKQAFREYLKAYPGFDNNPEYYIFFNTKTNNYAEPIKRGQAWKFITTTCQEVGLQGNYGTNSLRKT